MLSWLLKTFVVKVQVFGYEFYFRSNVYEYFGLEAANTLVDNAIVNKQDKPIIFNTFFFI